MSAETLVITGTSTGVGKTIVTAAIAALAKASGRHVTIVKPGQTGVSTNERGAISERNGISETSDVSERNDISEPSDIEVAARLSGVTDLHELARLPDPLSPAAAARVAGLEPLDLTAAARTIRALAQSLEDSALVLVEGAGGLLVDFDDEHHNIADLASDLNAQIVLVVAPNLGTLNHTALTLEAMKHRNLTLHALVIGSWPGQPDLACRTNIADLERLAGTALGGAMSEGSAALSPTQFLAAADAGLAPTFGGQFDASDFQERFGHRRKA